MRLLLLFLLVSLSMTACGQKGALYIPKQPEVNKDAPIKDNVTVPTKEQQGDILPAQQQ
ncbi:lipoprotein [Shewanella intestini]|nr:lipoprotein [Shewanella intestini]